MTQAMKDSPEAAAELTSTVGVPPDGPGGGHRPIGSRSTSAADPALIASIRELHAHRMATGRMEYRIQNMLKAMARRALGWSYDLEPKERNRLNNEAAAIVSATLKGEDHDNAEAQARVEPIVSVSLEPLNAYVNFRKRLEKSMKAEAKELPGWPFVEATRGIDALGLAQIVGEAGDLSNYANPGKLWKRFGLAPHNGKLPSHWRLKGGLSADDWWEMGYSPVSRSIMHTVGKAIEYQSTGEYKQLYLDRKAYEYERDPEMKPHIAQKRALVYVEKRLLRELWKAWNRA